MAFILIQQYLCTISNANGLVYGWNKFPITELCLRLCRNRKQKNETFPQNVWHVSVEQGKLYVLFCD